jgi:hypothetical protein
MSHIRTPYVHQGNFIDYNRPWTQRTLINLDTRSTTLTGLIRATMAPFRRPSQYLDEPVSSAPHSGDTGAFQLSGGSLFSASGLLGNSMWLNIPFVHLFQISLSMDTNKYLPRPPANLNSPCCFLLTSGFHGT